MQGIRISQRLSQEVLPDDLAARPSRPMPDAYFRERKLTRQIIIITHNPNLVVTTDSEQIIVGAFDGSRTPRIQYRAGSLEDTGIAPDDGIREEVCRVLEGGIDGGSRRRVRGINDMYS